MENTLFNLILCEGETDRTLLGKYLENAEQWIYKKIKHPPIDNREIEWYQDKMGKTVGIWAVGGNDFTNALNDIIELEKLSHSVERLLVFTDHDDEQAERERPEEIFQRLVRTLGVSESGNYNEYINRWKKLKYNDHWGECEMNVCYVLVPLNDMGALETYMLTALSENEPEQKKVISQVRSFIAGFESDRYLRHQRERIKAELGIVMSIFSPDRVFTTMNELLDSVKWEKFRITEEQLARIREV